MEADFIGHGNDLEGRVLVIFINNNCLTIKIYLCIISNGVRWHLCDDIFHGIMKREYHIQITLYVGGELK